MKRLNSRLSNVIEKDRLIITSETSSLIVYDIKRLLDSYFNVEGEVNLIVNESDCGYDLTINAKASNIKNFKILSK
jgi:hypothetical protein